MSVAQDDLAGRADRCAWCKAPAAPPHILPYLFYDHAGKATHRWLHAQCSIPAHAKYAEKRRRWLEEDAADGR